MEDLRAQLESKDDDYKIAALKRIIYHIINGDGQTMSKLFMPVIMHCLNSENHAIKKLLMVYWEVVDKKKPGGAGLLPEMILVWYVFHEMFDFIIVRGLCV